MIEAEDNHINPTNMAEEADQAEKGKSGRGKVGSGGAGVYKILPNKLKEIMNIWEYLDVNKAVARMAEFFSEGVTRASANLEVKWESVTKGGFAVVSHALEIGSDLAKFVRGRERSREGMQKKLREKYGIRLVLKPSPTVG
jgi:hypothetical protein